MANKEHIEILKKGVKVWNEWREKNWTIKIDLENVNLNRYSMRGVNFLNANLSKANLCKADLMDAKLGQTNLSNADLSSATLLGADLGHANLSGANLRGTNLNAADLMLANLYGASLVNAQLLSTNFYKTILSNTNFSNSMFAKTMIINCDLTEALGLTKVEHLGPSIIGIDTILRSKGNIPVAFLKDSGIPKEIIDHILPIAKGREFYSCFISYSVKDEIFAEKLKKDLEKNNIQYWFFPDDAIWGKDLYKNIDMAIETHDKVIVICSENSLNSEPVLKEIQKGLDKEEAQKEKHKETKRVLFPITKDNYLFEKWEHYLKSDLLRITVGDFRNHGNPKKYKEAFDKLLKGLQK